MLCDGKWDSFDIKFSDVSYFFHLTKEDMKEGVLYVPLIRTFPAADILFISNKKAYAVQVTFGETHRIERSAYYTLRDEELKLQKDEKLHYLLVPNPEYVEKYARLSVSRFVVGKMPSFVNYTVLKSDFLISL